MALQMPTLPVYAGYTPGLDIISTDFIVFLQMSGGAHQKKQECPKVNCLSTRTFISLIVIQMLAVIGYMFYKSHQDQAAKKFY